MGKKSKNGAVEEPEQDGPIPADDGDKMTYEDRAQLVIPIAQPLASRKLAKKVSKIVKKARSHKSLVIGLKSVKKQIRKGAKGIVVLAGDTDPMDIVSHFPITCEDVGIPYVWVPSRQDIGGVVVLIQSNDEYEDSYKETYKKVKELPHPI